ncbi:MAG: o-succinylbenzoate synthase [Bacteroidales bacterium]|nr:o-succinylbenzoate synthase [Bacteroidales bacterium]
MLKARWQKHTLKFSFPAGTSRGKLHEKDSYFIIITDDETGKHGIGECGLLKGLSFDNRHGYEDKLTEICTHIDRPDMLSSLDQWPSIQFGVEMALKSLQHNDPMVLFPSDFTDGKLGVLINGLIWMGEPAYMRSQIEKKLEEGFDCIKMKIGAIGWQAELELLEEIRSYFPADVIELRVDANGAFTKQEALQKLEQLAKLDIHSIEQPIKAGHWNDMAEICRQTPLPVALDEELIGVIDPDHKNTLIKTVKPQYIILKPSLVGGFEKSAEWISIAEENGAGWWITSALESNVGLNAIAQWTYTLSNPLPQGLGTGQLFTNNIPSPLQIKKGKLFYDVQSNWDLSLITRHE